MIKHMSVHVSIDCPWVDGHNRRCLYRSHPTHIHVSEGRLRHNMICSSNAYPTHEMEGACFSVLGFGARL